MHPHQDNLPLLDIIPMVSKDCHNDSYYVILLKVYNSDLTKVISYGEVTSYPLWSPAYARPRVVVAKSDPGSFLLPCCTILPLCDRRAFPSHHCVVVNKHLQDRYTFKFLFGLKCSMSISSFTQSGQPVLYKLQIAPNQLDLSNSA